MKKTLRPESEDKMLKYYRWPAMCVHGDKKQEERDWVIGEFRSGSSPILLATDVAARGLGKSAHIVLKTTAKIPKMPFFKSEI